MVEKMEQWHEQPAHASEPPESVIFDAIGKVHSAHVNDYKCLKCGNNIDNSVFTYCDDCWNKRPKAHTSEPRKGSAASYAASPRGEQGAAWRVIDGNILYHGDTFVALTTQPRCAKTIADYCNKIEQGADTKRLDWLDANATGLNEFDGQWHLGQYEGDSVREVIDAALSQQEHFTDGSPCWCEPERKKT